MSWLVLEIWLRSKIVGDLLTGVVGSAFTGTMFK